MAEVKHIVEGDERLATSAEKTAWNGKQAAITASGILKGDGAGGVTAATAGSDYLSPAGFSGLDEDASTLADVIRALKGA